MKNTIIKFVFAFIMMAGIGTASAQSIKQDQDRPEVIAKEKVNALDAKLDLTGDQERTLFRAIVSKITNYRKHINGKDENSTIVKAKKSEIDKKFSTTINKTLTKKQMQLWKEIKKNK